MLPTRLTQVHSLSSAPTHAQVPSLIDILAILLSPEADADEGARDSASKLLARINRLHLLADLSAEELARLSESNITAGRRLKAAFALNHLEQGENRPEVQSMRGSSEVFRFFQPLAARARAEIVWMVFLDVRLRTLGTCEIARGTLHAAPVHPREVFREILLRQASGFILVHNHPSGDPQPSTEDLRLTKELTKLAALMRVDFIDHVIVTSGTYFSMADRRMM